MKDECCTGGTPVTTTHPKGDEDCEACRPHGARWPRSCGRTLDLVIKDGKKRSERLCDGLLHVMKLYHDTFTEMRFKCDLCGDEPSVESVRLRG